MQPGDLTTLARAKAWLSLNSEGASSSDATIARLISAASAAVLEYTSRPWPAVTRFDDVYDGRPTPFLQLRNAPVVEVLSVNCSGVAIAASPDPNSVGYALDTPTGNGALQRLILRGRNFGGGLASVAVSYTAGYQRSETFTAAAVDGAVTYAPVGPIWLQDDGVAFTSTGVALVKVSGAPAAGQYAVDSDGLYTFNASDAGLQLTVTYSYAPADLEQAVIEIIGERFKGRDRIGQTSVTVSNQQTLSFSQREVHAYVGMTLQPYRRVAPV